MAVVPRAVALGKRPVLRLPLVRKWPWPGIDPDDPDPSTGQGYWLAVAAILVIIGIITLVRG